MPTDDEKAHLKSWTSEKLEWLRCVSVDSQVKPGMFETAFAIIQHVNARTRVAIISDRTISDATNISTAEVFRHRVGLRKLGWITWARRRRGLRIRPLFDRINTMLDELDHRRQLRKVERIEGPLKRKPKIISRDGSTKAKIIIGDESGLIAGDEMEMIAGDEHTPSLYTISNSPSKILPPRRS